MDITPKIILSTEESSEFEDTLKVSKPITTLNIGIISVIIISFARKI